MIISLWWCHCGLVLNLSTIEVLCVCRRLALTHRLGYFAKPCHIRSSSLLGENVDAIVCDLTAIELHLLELALFLASLSEEDLSAGAS